MAAGRSTNGTTEDRVELIYLDGEQVPGRKSLQLDCVAFLRGTTADPEEHHHGSARR